MPSVRPLWAVASLLWTYLLAQSATGRAGDLGVLHAAGGRLAAGDPVYDQAGFFIYPPRGCDLGTALDASTDNCESPHRCGVLPWSWNLAIQ